MCSVVGYIGNNLSCASVMEGLSRLEYRGYDSAGYACLSSDNTILFAKSEGRLSNLKDELGIHPIDGTVGIGHTRWATHGRSNQTNAHPQFNCDKSIALVHNGIIENFNELRVALIESGHTFESETDTEVIAHLFEALLISHETLKGALTDLVSKLEGAYSFIIMSSQFPGKLLIARKRSPLCIGIGDNEMTIASDVLAFAGKKNKALFLPDQTYAIVSADLIELYDFAGHPLSVKPQEVNFGWDVHDKQDHDHFMLKEIYDQKSSIHDTLDFLSSHDVRIWDYMNLDAKRIKEMKSLNLIGCGTSWMAARIAQFFFESIALMPCRVYLASEFRYSNFFPDRNGVYIAVSQSGETADTLEALRLINQMNCATVALTNVSSSTMVREAGGFLLTQAGREIAVASTKAFSTQVTALYWLAHRIAFEKGLIKADKLDQAGKELIVAAEILEDAIERYKYDIIHKHAPVYAQFGKAIFIGRHVGYPFAMEAALKLKEISYIFSQAYPAGELKHGPLALIDGQIPVFAFSHATDVIYQKLLGNVQEIKARSGQVISYSFEGQDSLQDLSDVSFIFPRVNPLLGPLAMTGLMQFFAYAMAKELNCPIDNPRNLAKSVTVE